MNLVLEYLIVFITVICVLFGIYFIVPMLVKYYLRERFNNIISKSDYVYLTFDDGPDPSTTVEVLKVLNRHKVNATFFLTGQNVEKYPNVVTQIVNSGHSIGEHSYEHTHAWRTGPVKTAKDLLKGKRVIEKFTNGRGMILFRPPFGKMNFVTLLYILIYRRKVAFWSIDAKDFLSKDKKEIASYILSKLKPGKVILLHDKNRNGTEMIGALELILENVKNSNMKFAALDDV